MAAQIWQVALDRLDPLGSIRRPGESMAEFTYGPEGMSVAAHIVEVLVRPRLEEVRDRSGRGAGAS